MSSLLVREQDGVITLTMNRPQVRNAIDDAMMSALDSQVSALADRKDLVAVVLTGAGEESFCAGGDLRWMRSFDTPEKGQGMSRRMQDILHRLAALPVPVIGVLNGYAFGGGTEVALATDMRVLETHAFLCFKQVQVGVMTGWGGGGRLLHLVGYARALELLTTCRRVHGAEARSMGLANVVVPRGEGLAEALRICERLKRGAPGSIRASKALLRGAHGKTIHEAADLENELFGEVWASVDHLEALEAFDQKRRPDFRK
ncbi:MAG: enoyl-CoA hydratase/isomerase family protein [Myxococcota bacterium]|jgi:enoyl-CoA hydratase|nr:enoyl-CoA hydratase/isomerase family protein [Myxococcota bacterium]